MRQLVYTMFITNNHALFHLWWKENFVKHQEVSKLYGHNCKKGHFNYKHNISDFIDLHSETPKVPGWSPIASYVKRWTPCSNCPTNGRNLKDPFLCCPVNRKCLRKETLKEKKSKYEDESVVHNKSAKIFKTKNPELSKQPTLN